MMIIDEKGHIKPILLKFGAAMALSLGGIIYTYFKSNKIDPSLDEQTDSGGRRNDNHALYNSSSGPEKHESPSDNCSPCAKSNGENDGYVLPEYNELAQDFSFTTKTGLAPRNEMDSRQHKCTEKDDNIYELEIRSLRNMVNILKERERDLEIQLLEYYGLKEQEKAVMELQNRLEINNVEAKLFKLKIESLEADKKRLEEQASDHAKVSAAFEDAKAKVKFLKKKLRSEAEQNREQILALQERVVNFQENEEEYIAVKQADIHAKHQRIKDMEKEAEELKNTNNRLRLENSELAHKVDFLHCIATTVLNDDEKAAAKKECQRLQQEKENLSKEIERLHLDRSADIEELVHLRWLNACYRNALRNPRNSPGEPVSRELNATVSPLSEGKGNSDQRDPSITDSGEDSSSMDLSSGTPTHRLKQKVINKFMRLLRGKRRDNNQNRRSRSGDTSAYIEDMMGAFPSYSPASHSGVSSVTDIGPDGMYESSRCSSRGSRFSATN